MTPARMLVSVIRHLLLLVDGKKSIMRFTVSVVSCVWNVESTRARHRDVHG